MDLTLTEDQATIQATARELLAARSAAAGARAVAPEPAGFSVTLWDEVVGLGWTGLALPEEVGGVGQGFVELCLLIEELGRHQVPLPLASTVACAALPIARHGTAEQRKEWLGAVVDGRILTYAMATPGGGWDAAGAAVSVREAGDGSRLDGSATLVPYADVASELLVVAHRPASEEPLVAIVALDAAGVTRSRLDVVGPDPMHRVDVDGVVVPRERVLGGVEQGPALVGAMTAFGAVATCASMVGGAQRVLDMTVEHARQRRQFGSPIGSFQAVQHHCANMAIDVLSARLLAYEAAWRLDQGGDAAVEVTAAKAAVSDAYERVVALGHQVHGAIGFTKEHDMQLYSRHAMAAALSFGDGAFHWDRLADRLGLPRPGDVVRRQSGQGPNSA